MLYLTFLSINNNNAIAVNSLISKCCHDGRARVTIVTLSYFLARKSAGRMHDSFIAAIFRNSKLETRKIDSFEQPTYIA